MLQLLLSLLVHRSLLDYSWRDHHTSCDHGAVDRCGVRAALPLHWSVVTAGVRLRLDFGGAKLRQSS